jgi:Cys-tRNA(Pro)/Cys-tRNA(Cys) deacylase
MKKDYPVFIDETALIFDKISISAGVRGTQIVISPIDLISTVEATTGDLI